MRTSITPWQTFKDIGVKVFDAKDISIDKIDNETKQINRKKIKEYFSENTLIIQWKKIFGAPNE